VAGRPAAPLFERRDRPLLARDWDLVRGATPLRQPPPEELGRRYVEMLAENLGQPGFRELLLACTTATRIGI